MIESNQFGNESSGPNGRREFASEAERSVETATDRARAWLDRTLGQFTDVNLEEIEASLMREVRARPGRALLVAGAVGLFVGALLRRA